MLKKLNRKLIPLIVLELYLLLTVFLHFFGPLNYETPNVAVTVLMIALYQIAILIGYLFSLRKEKNEIYEKKSIVDRIPNFNLNWLYVTLFFAMIVSYVSLASFSFTLNPLKIFSDIIQGIKNPSEVYTINNLIVDPYISSRVINIILMLLSACAYFSYAVGIYKFKECSWFMKILLIIALALEVSTGLIRGTNIPIFRILVIFISIVALLILKNISRVPKKFIFIGLSLVAVFVVYFVIATSSRMAVTEVPDVIFGLEVNKNNLMMKLLPGKLQIAFIMISFYLSQGYYALAMTFNYSFYSTFGFGSGWFLIQNFEKVLNVDLYSRTYVSMMRYFWNPTINWHSVYTWFANDFSVYGVVIIMFAFGYLLRLVIKDSLKGNIFAITLLPLFVLFAVFIPANNNVLASPQTAIPFIFFLFVYLFDKWLFNARSIQKEKTRNNYLFIGGVYEKPLEREYIRKSKNNGIQNAVNIHQWNYVKGIKEFHNIEILSARYLHSFPKYKDLYVSSLKTIDNHVYVNNVGYINLPVLKQFTKVVGLLMGAISWVVRTSKEERVIFVYYPNALFLFVASFIKRIFKGVRVNVIVPDLPEYTNISQKGNAADSLNKKLYYKYLSCVDKYILLTDDMKEFFNIIAPSQYFVMEGLIDKDDFAEVEPFELEGRHLVYSGSLNISYGIEALVKSFIEDEVDATLHIFGKGEFEQSLLNQYSKHSNVKYHGYVSREEILKWEKSAHIVVNPRNDIAEFNRYSFPSKNLEYLLSSTPFVGYKLGGIPNEYDEYINYVGADETIGRRLQLIFENYEVAKKRASEGRLFVLEEKNLVTQCHKMMTHFGYLRCEVKDDNQK